MLEPERFFELSGIEGELFRDMNLVWDALKNLEKFLREYAKPEIRGIIKGGVFIEGNVFIDEGTVIEPFVYIKGPAYIGKNCEIRQGAYIRGNVFIGDNCVVGHTTEIKNSILLSGAKAPHFNYVGDSILGHNVNLGAGTKISNLKIGLSGTVKIRVKGEVYDTGLRKLGAIIGDDSETGCNSVLNPGTIIGKRVLIYPNASVRGFIPEKSIVKFKPNLDIIEIIENT
ncbi:MAG: glucose-1-phosphate thymidylyltransferase [Dictyoglomus thermophilum]|nr:glucose-1-phosphate thymidylyltransferase [Dictyoglomus thermophilum]MCX7720391.1 glucose-1-phosphate thymidylyltransferase [Dictyoglomus thermophilum]